MTLKLSRRFYDRPDVVLISRDLLGKFLVTRLDDGQVTTGMIVETEAYRGSNDRASHAFNNRRTDRTEIMFRGPGTAYVYLCYGVHHLFNIVTNKSNIPHAVLIRAIQPVDGIRLMLRRRGMMQQEFRMTAGPGALTRALGITVEQTGIDLLGGTIWLEDRKVRVKDSDVVAGPRVGVTYAGPDAQKPWRFRIKDNPWVSKAR